LATIKALLEHEDTGGDREIHGQWWRPEDPATRVGGRLVYTRESGVTLTLNGALPRDEDDYSPCVLLGLTTENEHVTLPSAYCRGHGWIGMGDEGTATRQDWLSFEVGWCRA
jgi:hypothetical protein